ncbi:hypothetical protein [Micromonospora sp. NPDC050200]
MEQRSLDRLGRRVGVVDLGAWQLGADWGQVSAVYDELVRPPVHDRW